MSEEVASHDIARNRASDETTATGLNHTSHGTGYSLPDHQVSPQQQPNYSQHRYRLRIRQGPRAGRACSNGKDRRPVDPPPVLQLCLADFDPNSPHDVDELRDSSFTVNCLLRAASVPHQDLSVVRRTDESTGVIKAEKQINGGTVASPFFCDEDPDPDTGPLPSFASTFSGTAAVAGSSPYPHLVNGHHLSMALPSSSPRKAPAAAFFLFPDLSVRRAGVYRLEFQLFKINMDQQKIPLLHSVLSDPFNIVNAKDFDYVQPSTPLVKGLKRLGAPFPLKLKQGTRANKTLHGHLAEDDRR